MTSIVKDNNEVNIKYDRPLDSKLALSLIGKESPNDLIVSKDFITRIGNLCDVNFIRKLNISFNNIKTLDGIDQLPQLKELYAYSCNLSNISNIQSNTKLETIMLQQNNISKISEAFLHLTKLQELRLDKNRIIKIENLYACTNIRKLDLSFNGIEQLTGLQALQHLTELKVTNNLIKSISTIKSLPSIKEIDLSNNQLKNLEGLQQLPTLEVLNVNHNLINELKISPSNPNKQSKQQDYVKASTQIDNKVSSNKSSNSKNNHSSSLVLPELPKAMLIELYLAGNRIRNVEGLEHLSHCLDTLDVSSNNLSVETGNILIKSLEHCKQLTELRIHGNICTENEEFIEKLSKSLSASCRKLKAIDGMSFVDGIASSEYTSNSDAVFHTWNDDASGIFPERSEMKSLADDASHSIVERTVDELIQSDDSDSDYEKENKQSRSSTAAQMASNKDENKTWVLKPMLSEDDILSVASKFRNHLQDCKNKLAVAASIFEFANKDSDDKVIDKVSSRVENENQTLLVHSESGKRVAAALDKAAAVVSLPYNSHTQKEQRLALVSDMDSNQMKEKLVDRVRQAVSTSVVSALSSSPSFSTTTAPPVVLLDDKKNSPLLTDDIRSSSDYKRSDNSHMKESKEVLTNDFLSNKATSNQKDKSKASTKHATNISILSTKPTILQPSNQQTNLGSGLTRYGTRTNYSNYMPHTSGHESVASSSSVLSHSMMNIVHTNLDNFSIKETDIIDLTNLKLKKQNNLKFMNDLSPDKSIYTNESDELNKINQAYTEEELAVIRVQQLKYGYDARREVSAVLARTDSDSAFEVRKNSPMKHNTNHIKQGMIGKLSIAMSSPNELNERRHSEPNITSMQSYTPRSPSTTVASAQVVKTSNYQSNAVPMISPRASATMNSINRPLSAVGATFPSSSSNMINVKDTSTVTYNKEPTSQLTVTSHKMKFQIPKTAKDLLSNQQIEKEILKRSTIDHSSSIMNPTIGHSIMNSHDDTSVLDIYE